MSQCLPSDLCAADKALATYTHARLRAAQGDLERAGQLLREVLARNPDDDRARDLLDSLTRRRSASLRARRLERWLEQVSGSGRG